MECSGAARNLLKFQSIKFVFGTASIVCIWGFISMLPCLDRWTLIAPNKSGGYAVWLNLKVSILREVVTRYWCAHCYWFESTAFLSLRVYLPLSEARFEKEASTPNGPTAGMMPAHSPDVLTCAECFPWHIWILGGGCSWNCWNA
jgi:hypothetical protein